LKLDLGHNPPEKRKSRLVLTSFQFAGHTLDVARGSLRASDREVALRPKSFEVLRYLVEHAGRLVNKGELIEAIWPGTVATDELLMHCVSEVRHALGDGGRTIIKTVPRRGYRFDAPVSRAATDWQAAPIVTLPRADLSAAARCLEPPLPNRPSIAVLSFQNMSGEPAQEYFTDGVVEEIITALSRFSNLFVIARNSSFTYKNRPVDVRQVGRELGVRYVLEGSIRKTANRVRITAQLVEAAGGTHLWADRFECGLDDVFDMQDHVTVHVVSAIVPKLEQAEIARAKRKPTESLDAYDYLLRGMERLRRNTRASVLEALRLFSKAIELDPDSAAAHALAAYCYVQRRASRWMTDPVWEITEATRLAREAVRLGKDDAASLARAGHALALLIHEYDAAGSFIDRALLLNPNLATA
jgi:TolB-like protein